MTQFLEMRKKIVELYQKVDYIFMPLFRFLLAFCGFVAIKNVVGFNAKYSSLIIIIALSVISAFVPTSITVAIMVLYVALQLMNVSVFMSGTVIVLAIILFCFFLRFISKYAAGVIGMPVLIGMKIPYTLPIVFGLFATPITIVPTCLGVFSYYFLCGIKANISTLEQVSSSKEPYVLFTNVLTNVLKNEEMFATMIVLSLVIVIVYCVRNIKMDYSFEIAVGVGAAVSMLGFIILMLKFDLSTSVLGVIFCSIISALLSLLVYFFYRPLRYAASESVQFEDDDYYYYVKAIPKIKITGIKVNERQVINRRRTDSDEIDDEEFEDLESRIIDMTDDEIDSESYNNRRRAVEELDSDMKIAPSRQVKRQVINPINKEQPSAKPNVQNAKPANMGARPVNANARPVNANPNSKPVNANPGVRPANARPASRQATASPVARVNGQVVRPNAQPNKAMNEDAVKKPVTRPVKTQDDNADNRPNE